MDNKYAWVNLALFYAIAQDWDQTEAAWLYVDSLYPNDTEILNYIGNFYRNESHVFDLSEKYYRKSLAVDPAQPGIYAELHYFLRRQRYYRMSRPSHTCSDSGMQSVERLLLHERSFLQLGRVR